MIEKTKDRNRVCITLEQNNAFVKFFTHFSVLSRAADTQRLRPERGTMVALLAII